MDAGSHSQHLAGHLAGQPQRKQPVAQANLAPNPLAVPIQGATLPAPKPKQQL